MKRIFHVLLMLGALVGPSLADHVITMEATDLGDPGDVSEIQVFMSADNLKMLNPAETTTIVYKAKDEAIYMVDDARKEYVVMNEEMMKQMGDQMEGMSKQMEEMAKQMQEALAQVPEEQREMAEKMMKDKMPAAAMASTPESTIEVVKTGEKENIAGKPCERYDITKNGTKTTEIWVTPWNRADMGEKDFAIFKEMAAFMKEMMSASPFMAQGAENEFFAGVDEIDGFPVMTREFRDGKATEETVLKSVEKKKLDTAVFALPEGYKKVDPFAEMKGQ